MILHITKEDLGLLKQNTLTSEQTSEQYRISKAELESIKASYTELEFDISSILNLEATN